MDNRSIFFTSACVIGVAIATLWYFRRSPPKEVNYFYLFGSPISKSPSPTLHNAGFQHYNLNNYQYKLCDTLDINEVVKTLQSDSTRGGSVTMPHKQTIIPFLYELTSAAQEIGAVNTVYKQEGKLMGDNTDWVAIYVLSKKRLEAIHPHTHLDQLSGLVVGAGGTAHAACYALYRLGIPFFIWNRSEDKATKLAQKFGGKSCAQLDSIPQGSIDIVIGTVPPTSQFSLPKHLLKKNLVVVELVYFPRETTLLKQAKEKGCTIVEGSEILFEQGVVQFKIFSDKDPPRREMAYAMVYKHNSGALEIDTPLTFKEILEK